MRVSRATEPRTVFSSKERDDVARHRRSSVFAQNQRSGVGTAIFRMLLVLVVLTLIGGAVFLGFWDVQPPVETVERPIPRDRFLP